MFVSGLSLIRNYHNLKSWRTVRLQSAGMDPWSQEGYDQLSNSAEQGKLLASLARLDAQLQARRGVPASNGGAQHTGTAMEARPWLREPIPAPHPQASAQADGTVQKQRKPAAVSGHQGKRHAPRKSSANSHNGRTTQKGSAGAASKAPPVQALVPSAVHGNRAPSAPGLPVSLNRHPDHPRPDGHAGQQLHWNAPMSAPQNHGHHALPAQAPAWPWPAFCYPGHPATGAAMVPGQQMHPAFPGLPPNMPPGMPMGYGYQLPPYQGQRFGPPPQQPTRHQPARPQGKTDHVTPHAAAWQQVPSAQQGPQSQGVINCNGALVGMLFS